MSPLPHHSRRSFVKKSIALSIAASQPAFLLGLVKANGSTSSTEEYTKIPDTTDPYTTVWEEVTTSIPVTEPITTMATTAVSGSGALYL